ncbi:MAG: archease [Promethearchaeota archaeon]
MSTGHEFLDHPADIQLHAWAPTIEDLFRETGKSLMSIIVEGGTFSITKEIPVEVEAEDLKALLFDWLTEILYLFDTELFVIADIVIDGIYEKSDGQWMIKSLFKGERFDEKKHVPGTEVKAITYSYMTLEKEKDDLFHLYIIFDI